MRKRFIKCGKRRSNSKPSRRRRWIRPRDRLLSDGSPSSRNGGRRRPGIMRKKSGGISKPRPSRHDTRIWKGSGQSRLSRNRNSSGRSYKRG